MLPNEPALPTRALLDAAGLHPRFRAATERITSIPTAEGASDSERLLRDEFVPSNRPALLQSALQDWAPVLRWSDDNYLRSAAPDAKVSARRVASGTVASGSYESDEISWPTLVDSLAAASHAGISAAPHYAAQLRLRTSLPTLFADTRPEPPLLRALGAVWRNAPSAYIGCGARTPLHFDLLENIFCVVTGVKHVALWPPADGGLLYPGDDGGATFSRADIYIPDLEAFPLLREALSHALHVKVSAGDALYIPVGWWHAVSTPPGVRSISVSYWAQQPEGKTWEMRERDEEEAGGAGGGVNESACAAAAAVEFAVAR